MTFRRNKARFVDAEVKQQIVLMKDQLNKTQMQFRKSEA